MADLYSMLAIGEYLQRQQQASKVLASSSLPLALPQVYFARKRNEQLLFLCPGIQQMYQPIHYRGGTQPNDSRLQRHSTPESSLQHPVLDRLCKKIRAFDLAIQQCSGNVKQQYTKPGNLVRDFEIVL